jgi:Flp pilus assembly protein TadD
MQDGAIASAERAVERARDLAVTMMALACAYYLGGRTEDGGRILQELKERAQRGYVSPTLLALIHVARGAIDEAVACAERAYSERDHWLQGIRGNPSGVRFDDPRLQAILQRIGLS